MDLRKLIEEINRLTEDEFIDEFNTEVSDDNFTAEDNTTEQLNAKTKISRALDVLKEAVDDFKDVTLEELDLIADAELSRLMESLDDVISNIRAILNGESNGMKEGEPSEFEIEDEESQDEEEVEENEDEVEEESEDEEKESEEDEDEEINFDDEAELDLFGKD